MTLATLRCHFTSIKDSPKAISYILNLLCRITLNFEKFQISLLDPHLSAVI